MKKIFDVRIGRYDLIAQWWPGEPFGWCPGATWCRWVHGVDWGPLYLWIVETSRGDA